MAILGFELEEIARLIALVEAGELSELIHEEEGRYLRIRGPRADKPPREFAAAPASATTTPSAPLRARAITPPPSPASAKDQVILESPMMGIFYRAEKPGAPPLVHIGDHISVGQTVGIIEAMKVFSEFKAEQSGMIIAIPAHDGQLVQAQAPLFVLRKDA